MESQTKKPHITEDKQMKKTLWCEGKKITAKKVDSVNDQMNWYEDAEGNHYIVRYNNFKRRQEFVKVNA